MAKERFKVVPAVHLFLIKEDKILLARRYKTSWMDGYYSVPAGHVDGDEPATQAMIREAAEEAGIELRGNDLRFAHVMHRHVPEGKINERVDFFFVVDQWKGEPRIMEIDKCDEVGWFPLNKLPDKMVPYVRAAFEAYRKNVLYSEFEWPE